MYIQVQNDKITTKWLSKPAIHTEKTDAQLEAIGIYNVPTPDISDPYTNTSFEIVMENKKPVCKTTSRPLSLERAKAFKKTQIEAAWKKTLTHGKFTSTAVSGFEVDCRRFDVDNDPQNIAGKIKRIESGIEIEPIFWKGVSETRLLTLAELKAVELEMLDYANTSYNKKFIAGMKIDIANTIIEIKAIEF